MLGDEMVLVPDKTSEDTSPQSDSSVIQINLSVAYPSVLRT